MKKKLEAALNKQLNAELGSAYLYFSIEAYFISVNLNGFANWMHIQAQEEMQHAMKFFDFLNDRNAAVSLPAIPAPKSTWKSPLEAFQDAYKHEQKISKMINDLMDLATKENDHASRTFLQWFVEEQVEEEATALGIVEQIKLAGGSSGALFILDRELGQRTLGPAE